ncbi:hypothetical protein VNO78_12086 [Psophocarpus tetragonolobus]|uniref:Uncharacterized protein n=1 Tax=Psophocarpus tetragonolobus TaxID=3891 RepID=A0AAN9XP47_PSOTE
MKRKEGAHVREHGGVQRVLLQGLEGRFMWLTNRGDDGHMLVGIKPWMDDDIIGVLDNEAVSVFCSLARA